MRPFVSITIILTFCSIFTYGNTTREYIASKQGVTIICGGSFDSVESQKRLNNFLDFLLSKISRSDNRTKIVIQACVLGFDRLKGDKRKEFIFVGYDTLLKRDTIFFEKSELSYNQEIYNLLPTQTWMYNGWFPLFTIDSFYSTNDVGLKIKYLGYDPSIDFFDRLIEIVNYSLTNIDKIKTTQHYYPMPYFMNKGAFVSILSFDTASLNRIELKYYGFDKSLLPKSSYRIWAWTLSFLIGGIFIYLLTRRKKTTANIGIAASGAGRLNFGCLHSCTFVRADEFQFGFLLLTSTLCFQLGSGSGLDAIKYPTCSNTCPLYVTLNDIPFRHLLYIIKFIV